MTVFTANATVKVNEDGSYTIAIDDTPQKPSCAAEDYSAIRQRMEELRSEDAGGRHRVLVDRMYREMHHSLGMAMESLKLPKPSRVVESWVNSPPWHP